jgi:hypothetical protein
MTPLTRRLQRLEAGRRQSDELVADRCRNIHKAAFKHLSLDQKKCLLAAIISYQQGRQLTSEEAALLSAFDIAMKAECEKAGITVAEYRRHCGQATQPKTSGPDAIALVDKRLRAHRLD